MDKKRLVWNALNDTTENEVLGVVCGGFKGLGMNGVDEVVVYLQNNKKLSCYENRYVYCDHYKFRDDFLLVHTVYQTKAYTSDGVQTNKRITKHYIPYDQILRAYIIEGYVPKD
jgi:hypothetical protein